MRWILVPGDVRGADGDMHHVSCGELERLYGLRPSECTPYRAAQAGSYPPDTVFLCPREDGDYHHPHDVGAEVVFGAEYVRPRHDHLQRMYNARQRRRQQNIQDPRMFYACTVCGDYETDSPRLLESHMRINHPQSSPERHG